MKQENSTEEQNTENVTNETNSNTATESESQNTVNDNTISKENKVESSSTENTGSTAEKQSNETVNHSQNTADNTSSSKNGTGFSIKKEDLKKETTDAVNQVKDTLKNADIKKDSKEAKGFFTSFFKNPVEKMKEVGSSSGNNFLKIAIIILVVWLAIILVTNVASFASRYLFGILGNFTSFFKSLFSNFFTIVRSLVAPVITVLVLSGLVYGFKKDKNKSFLSIVNGILIAKIPVVLAAIFNLLTLISSNFDKIAVSFSGFCSILSTILLYFAIKNLSDEDKNDSYFWKFALIMGIFYIVKFVFSYLEIYL